MITLLVVIVLGMRWPPPASYPPHYGKPYGVMEPYHSSPYGQMIPSQQYPFDRSMMHPPLDRFQVEYFDYCHICYARSSIIHQPGNHS